MEPSTTAMTKSECKKHMNRLELFAIELEMDATKRAIQAQQSVIETCENDMQTAYRLECDKQEVYSRYAEIERKDSEIAIIAARYPTAEPPTREESGSSFFEDMKKWQKAGIASQRLKLETFELTHENWCLEEQITQSQRSKNFPKRAEISRRQNKIKEMEKNLESKQHNFIARKLEWVSAWGEPGMSETDAMNSSMNSVMDLSRQYLQERLDNFPNNSAYEVDLLEEIRALKEKDDRCQAMLAAAVAVRNRALEQAFLKSGTAAPNYAQNVTPGHLAAHEANVLADTQLYDGSYAIQRTDVDKFVEFYGVTPDDVNRHLDFNQLVQMMNWRFNFKLMQKQDPTGFPAERLQFDAAMDKFAFVKKCVLEDGIFFDEDTMKEHFDSLKAYSDMETLYTAADKCYKAWLKTGTWPS